MISQFLMNGVAIDAIADYSLTPRYFAFTTRESGVVEVQRMIVTIRDTAGFQAEEYGNLGSELTNGLNVVKRDGDNNEVLNLTPQSIKSNAEWASYCYDADIKTWGNGDEFLLVRWTFGKSGSPLKLKFGDSIAVRVNDDLQGLVSHRFLIQGQRLAG